MNPRVEKIVETLNELYPNAHCELVFNDPFELIVAVSLSAQTTDRRVNEVTPNLFKKYPDAKALAMADIEDVENIIRSIGLYHNKAKNIIALSQSLLINYGGIVPNKREELMKLSGVGRKTANVVLSVAYEMPALAVDTHVSRVAKRLGLAKYEDDVLEVERKLCRKIKKEYWNKIHHQFIFFGRYLCTAKNPHCDSCPLKQLCKKERYEKS